jgi:4-amino-4-deoxy-L-arabinose transferase-like glycosyltransferase
MAEPASLARPPAARGLTWVGAAVVGLSSALVFASNLPAEPHFADESAYLSQSYFADRFVESDWNDHEWLEYQGIDLPPLPKYLIGLALRCAGRPRPVPADARKWYRNPNTRIGSNEDLWLARVPSVILGALGCVALYALGTLAGDRRVGLLAAAILVLDPLYRVHARRAMSDVPCEAFTLATTAVALWVWRDALVATRGAGRILAWAAVAGALGGLAVLSKLSGGLALMIVAAWTLLGMIMPRFADRGKALLVVAASITGAASFAVFMALNPFLWSHPTRGSSPLAAHYAKMSFWIRAREVIRFRADVSDNARRIFPKDALSSPYDKISTVAVQGFGRFGPLGPWKLDSKHRFEWARDKGAVLWCPLVLLGAIHLIGLGRCQRARGEPPAAWALVVHWVITVVTVTAFIPLAWDRYMLPVQAISALLAAAAAWAACDRVIGYVTSLNKESTVS